MLVRGIVVFPELPEGVGEMYLEVSSLGRISTSQFPFVEEPGLEPFSSVGIGCLPSLTDWGLFELTFFSPSARPMDRIRRIKPMPMEPMRPGMLRNVPLNCARPAMVNLLPTTPTKIKKSPAKRVGTAKAILNGFKTTLHVTRTILICQVDNYSFQGHDMGSTNAAPEWQAGSLGWRSRELAVA